jgi:thiamine biosynthesis lipoprotein
MNEPLYKISFHALGTENILLAYGDKAEPALSLVQARLEEIDRRMSAFRSDSEIAQLAQQAGEAPAKVSPDTFQVLSEGKRIGALSQGAFDITIRPLSALWSFRGEREVLPLGEAIASALSKVDYSALLLAEKEGTAFLPKPGMSVDLGGLAKGYAADEAKRILLSHGVADALINLGGNILALGSYEGGKPWRVGLRNPLSLKGAYFAVLETHEETVVTSGIDEQFFLKHGKLYHHILDPRTGYPAESGLASVTVIGPKSLTADALATACFVLGKEQGTALLKAEGYKGVFVAKNGDVWSTFPLAL